MAIVRRWRANAGQFVSYEFPNEMQLIHDLIDPEQPQQQIATVYPVIDELIHEPAAVASA